MTGEAKAPLWRWQHVIAAVSAAAAVVAAVAVAAGDGRDVGPLPSATGGTATSGPPTPGPSTSGPPPLRPSAPPAGTRLGPDLAASSTEHCRTPGTATGSAWQVGAVRVDRRTYDPALSCNLFAGGEGSLDFVLGKSYRELRTTIGFADDSGALDHAVRFEVIADGSVYLAEPRVLRVGETVEVVVDVAGRSRLRLRIAEQGRAGGSGAFSRPVWAEPVLVP